MLTRSSRFAPPPTPEVDFAYVIHNADGGQVEHCGNGARCFVRYVHQKGLTHKNPIRVAVQQGTLTLFETNDGDVEVAMGIPNFDPEAVHFDTTGLTPTTNIDPFWATWLGSEAHTWHHHPTFPWWSVEVTWQGQVVAIPVHLVSMGNPHAVIRVPDVETAPVSILGALLEFHPRFRQRVNVGFMAIQSPSHLALRVYERGVGETLACGTGATAAVVAGIRQGWLHGQDWVTVQARGGRLGVQWSPASTAVLRGPADFVFETEIEFPHSLSSL